MRGAEHGRAARRCRVLTRAWQMLLKGLGEARQARRRPSQAAEMVLVRLAYAAELPAARHGAGDELRERAPAARGAPAAAAAAGRATRSGERRPRLRRRARARRASPAPPARAGRRARTVESPAASFEDVRALCERSTGATIVL